MRGVPSETRNVMNVSVTVRHHAAPVVSGVQLHLKSSSVHVRTAVNDGVMIAVNDAGNGRGAEVGNVDVATETTVESADAGPTVTSSYPELSFQSISQSHLYSTIVISSD